MLHALASYCNFDAASSVFNELYSAGKDEPLYQNSSFTVQYFIIQVEKSFSKGPYFIFLAFLGPFTVFTDQELPLSNEFASPLFFKLFFDF